MPLVLRALLVLLRSFRFVRMWLQGEMAVSPSPRTMSRLVQVFEASRCEVRREGKNLLILIPSWDRFFLDVFPGRPFPLQWFWDQVELKVNASEGNLTYALRYLSPGQILVHLILSAAIILDFLNSDSRQGSYGIYGAVFLVMNTVPAFLFLITAISVRKMVLRVGNEACESRR